MNTKHTPGPWPLETVSTSIGICHKIGRFPTGSVNHPIGSACVYADASGLSYQNEELLANARLIAAAPELLEACKTVITFLNRLEDGTGADDPLMVIRKRTHSPLRTALESAIAKAEGRA